MLELTAKGSTIEDDIFVVNQYLSGFANIYDFPIRYYIPETHSLLNYLRHKGKIIRLRFQRQRPFL